jgi:hypothetical protein
MFRFTIRDVLWLTVVVALVCAWSISGWRNNKQWLLRLNRSESEAVKFRNLYANERSYLEQLEAGTPPPVSESDLRDLLAEPKP